MTIPASVPTALQPLPASYHELYAHVLAAVEPDERVRGLWLSGSLARGTADAGSDLDLVLAIADDSFEEFVAGWRDWLATITPTLIANEIPGSKLIVYSLTDQICRLDLTVEPASQTEQSPHRSRVAVLDRDGLDARLPAPAEQPGPDPAAIVRIIEEFWRIQAIFPAMVDARRDLYCAWEGVNWASRLLNDLFVECNRPLPLMGAKQHRARLRPDQYALLTAVPAYGCDRNQLVNADLVICEAMNTAGRAAAEAAGAHYPERLAAAVTDHLAATVAAGRR